MDSYHTKREIFVSHISKSRSLDHILKTMQKLKINTINSKRTNISKIFKLN